MDRVTQKMGLRKQIERGGKRLLRAGLRVTFPGGRPMKVVPSAQDVQRVLVIRSDNRLGNLLMVTPLLEGLRKIWSHAQIHVLVSADAYPDVYRNHPHIDGVLIAPKKQMARNPIRALSFIRKLRKASYDVVFDASHMHEFSLTSALAARLSGAPYRIGYNRGEADRFLSVLVEAPKESLHECSVHLNLLQSVVEEPLELEPQSLRPTYIPTMAEREQAGRRWKKWGLGTKVVGIFLGARGKKRWPVERFLELVEQLSTKGFQCALFGGPAEHALLKKLPNTQKGTLVPVLPVREFAAVLENCEWVVSADTGPMHLAVALGKPVVSIFTGSDPQRYGYGHLVCHRVVGSPSKDTAVAEVLSAFEALNSTL